MRIPQTKRANLLKFKMSHFDFFFVDFLKYLKSLMIVCLSSMELQ